MAQICHHSAQLEKPAVFASVANCARHQNRTGAPATTTKIMAKVSLDTRRALRSKPILTNAKNDSNAYAYGFDEAPAGEE